MGIVDEMTNYPERGHRMFRIPSADVDRQVTDLRRAGFDASWVVVGDVAEVVVWRAEYVLV